MTWAIHITMFALLHSLVEAIAWALIRWNLESYQDRLEREWRERRVVDVRDEVPF